MFTSILHGLLTGFLFPIMPWFFFRDMPLPNFFDADAAATGQVDEGGVSSQVADSGVGGEIMPSVVFGKRMQVGACNDVESPAHVRWASCSAQC